jgi:hypothetical protein
MKRVVLMGITQPPIFCKLLEDTPMRNGTLGSITGRDEFIIAEAPATALVALEELPPTRQPTRNIADMKMLLNSLYPPSDVSVHLTTARWRFLPDLRPLGAREI